jgi:cytochrome c
VWALVFIAEGSALHCGGLDDFATLWHIAPRAAMEPIAGPFPRQFQVRQGGSDQVAAGALQLARKCRICHSRQADGANRADPTLHRIFGRTIGRLEGYPFSAALRRMDIVWARQTLNQLFELGPDVCTPDRTMPLQRMGDAAQRDALIAFLEQASKDAGVDPSIDEKAISAPESSPKGEQP